MAQTSVSEVYDLLILVDATASMTSYLNALKTSLPQVIAISALTDCFERIGVLAYRDYDQRQPEHLVEWSGWLARSDHEKDKPDIVRTTNALYPYGGYDWPEASKTALARAYQLMRQDATTVILHYTDAPPHFLGFDDDDRSNALKEHAALLSHKYGDDGHAFTDWVKASQLLAESNKRAHVLNILDSETVSRGDDRWYWYLAEMTGGATIILEEQTPRVISKITIEVLLSWMGVRKEGAVTATMPARLVWYEGVRGLKRKIEDCEDTLGVDLIRNDEDLIDETLWENTQQEFTPVSRDSLDHYLPRKKTALPNFTETYKNSAEYRAIVTEQLRDIIDRDVSAISLNPVFGSLWRVFCNDRENDHRQELLDLFGRKVDAIQNTEQKSTMKTWLAESYDYTAEVLEMISAVPPSQQFPCVCLDPTLAFTKLTKAADEAADDDPDESDRPITSFRRDELLEIGRSCDGRILRRLGRVLTRLTFIESAEDMPAHIAATKVEDVPRIPMALASKEYGRKFWRILLHIVIPGTMLSARPAALLAALSIRLGISPLVGAAEREMLFWRSNWNNIEVPETWNVSCLSLLLDADGIYRKSAQKRAAPLDDDEHSLLRNADRDLFGRLVEYKLLERNLDTTLTARVGWSPQQTSMPIGPLAVCKICELPRSVTVMGEANTCGLCLLPCAGAEEHEKALHARASKSDTEMSNALWYECNLPKCRSQYVVYNVEKLRVRPKCHYCRIDGVTADNGKPSSAPSVECVKCLSRMIWPIEYRPSEGLVDWECVACRAGRTTIIGDQVTPNQLRSENGQDWLIRNADEKIAELFSNRSLFHVAKKAAPLEDFCERLIILPGREVPQLKLFLRGKLIRNTEDLLDELIAWIHRRRVQYGTCSLCFSDKRKADLRRACGRSGCGQLICKECLEGWYGLNSPGRIINTAALSCPFCRRAPTGKTLAAYGMGVHAVGDLREAVEHRGEWIYAWCGECGYAKPFMERVCAGGAPPEMKDWMCDPCQETRTGAIMKKVKMCPGCGIATEKMYGCDHITCQVPNCGTHWCFYCGEKHDAQTIYQHMRVAHGGFFEGLDHNIDDDDEE